MTRRLLSSLTLALGVALLLAQPIAGSWSASHSLAAQRTANASTQHAAIAADYGQLPLAFELNAGQDANPSVRFLTHGSGYTLALTSSEARLALTPPTAAASHPSRFALPGQLVRAPAASTPTASTPLVMAWLGANPHPLVTGEQPLPGTANYFIGNNPAQWYTNIPTYQQVRLHNVYPGVDLVYYGNAGQLEYDFVVAPGANPARIALGFTGARGMGVDLLGNLSLALPGGAIAQAKPIIYQSVNGSRQPIVGGYTLASGGRVGFALGAYNPHLPLVIDPSYRFSTYLGGNGGDGGYGIAVDSSGNAYVVGFTFSTDFPTVNPEQTYNGSQDVFVSKLNAAGTALSYSTYLGGTSADGGNAIALDGSGNAYVTGYAYSTDFPTVNPLQASNAGSSDAFVSKLNATGSALVYSTYLGGNGYDEGAGIAVDPSGNAYVTGNTGSTNFPTQNPLQANNAGSGDAFVSKLNAAGSALVYSTYLGGSGTDLGNAIAADASGNVYVTGNTLSGDFPTSVGAFQSANAGAYDVFVSKLNASGSTLVYSTYLGGSGTDLGNAIALDSSGEAYVTGSTTSPNFPTNPPGITANGAQDVFVTKFDASGSGLIYSTYLGGSGADYGTAIAVDASGEVYVTGYTFSGDFLLVNPLQSTLRGTGDAFVTKFNTAGSLPLFSTYLGGSGGEQANGIAVGTGGNVYVTGLTNSSDFPIANAFQPALDGGQDAFVTKIATLPTPVFTPGVFRPSTATFYLRNANASGYADISATFGAGTDTPLIGDWTGKGYRSIGVFRNGAWYLRNANTTGGADITAYFGTTGDVPVVGDWTGKGYDSIGIFRNGTWYLSNSNTNPRANITITFGTAGDIPVVGDWTGKGYDSIGVYRPSLGAFFLRNSNSTGGPNLIAFFGAIGDTPLIGDWTGKGYDSIGVYRPSNRTFYLRNSNTTSGYADLSVVYGASGDKPLVGQWALFLGSSKPFRRSATAPAHPAAAAPTRQAATTR